MNWRPSRLSFAAGARAEAASSRLSDRAESAASFSVANRSSDPIFALLFTAFKHAFSLGCNQAPLR